MKDGWVGREHFDPVPGLMCRVSQTISMQNHPLRKRKFFHANLNHLPDEERLAGMQTSAWMDTSRAREWAINEQKGSIS